MPKRILIRELDSISETDPAVTSEKNRFKGLHQNLES